MKSRDDEDSSLVAVDCDGTGMSSERHGQLALDVEAEVGGSQVRSRLILGLRRLGKALEDGSCRSRSLSAHPTYNRRARLTTRVRILQRLLDVPPQASDLTPPNEGKVMTISEAVDRTIQRNNNIRLVMANHQRPLFGILQPSFLANVVCEASRRGQLRATINGERKRTYRVHHSCTYHSAR